MAAALAGWLLFCRLKDNVLRHAGPPYLAFLGPAAIGEVSCLLRFTYININLLLPPFTAIGHSSRYWFSLKHPFRKERRGHWSNAMCMRQLVYITDPSLLARY